MGILLDELRRTWEIEALKSTERETVLSVIWKSLVPDKAKSDSITKAVERALADVDYDD